MEVSPPRCTLTMSLIVDSNMGKTPLGKISLRKFNTSLSKCFMGTQGISENKKIIPGNRARIKKKEIDEALILKASFRNSSRSFTNTSYSGMPSNPGKTSFFIRCLKRSERTRRLYLSKVEIKNSFIFQYTKIQNYLSSQKADVFSNKMQFLYQIRISLH